MYFVVFLDNFFLVCLLLETKTDKEQQHKLSSGGLPSSCRNIVCWKLHRCPKLKIYLMQNTVLNVVAAMHSDNWTSQSTQNGLSYPVQYYL